MLLKRFDVGGAFRCVGFPEHLLAFLPTQAIPSQEFAQGGATDFAVKDRFDPTP
jgi:hypothetical protein